MAIDNNGNVTQKLVEMLLKQGSWAVLSAVLLYAFWVVALEPAAKERMLFVDTMKENSISNRECAKKNSSTLESISKSNDSIRVSVEIQQETLKTIQEEIAGQTELRKVAMDTMNAFAGEVRKDHPTQNKKHDENSIILDTILKKIQEHDHADSGTRNTDE